VNTSIVYRIFGVILIVFAGFGFLTVADDLRHAGEFIGVAALLLSGIILYFVKSLKGIIRNFAIEWVAFGILFGIPFGGIVLDNMIFGVLTGIVLGIVMAFAICRKRDNHPDK
jgi:hypothetical protein